MKPYFESEWGKLFNGDCLEVMKRLPDESIQCCVTSPPYWGLRDYGTAKWEGGSKDCDHLQGPLASQKSTLQGYTGNHVKLATGGMPYKDTCGKCGAKRIDNQIGLEKSPEEYITKLVEVFREVRRVLRKDGTLWVVIGDSYSGYHGNSKVADNDAPSNKPGYIENMRQSTVGINGLKPKDLCGIPWRVALALQADGWWLRSDIIWHKPGPMPESVTDRPTKAHEYIFLLSKNQRYYYDAEAIREESITKDTRSPYTSLGAWELDGRPAEKRNSGKPKKSSPDLRNKRSVWTINTYSYKGAHFATYPPALIEPCILAGSKPGDTILDPFFGSGTTGMVAGKYGRRWVGIELNEQYCAIAKKRILRETRQRALF